MPTFVPDPDDFSDNYRDGVLAHEMVLQLRRAVGTLLAQSLPKYPNPALQVQREASLMMNKMLAQQVNRSTASSIALAANRMLQPYEDMRLRELESVSASLNKMMAARVDVRGFQKAIANLSAAIQPSFPVSSSRPHVTRPSPIGPGGVGIEPADTVTDTEIADSGTVGDLSATLEGVETYIRGAAWGIYWFVYKHHIVIGIALVAVGELVVPVLIAIYL